MIIVDGGIETDDLRKVLGGMVLSCRVMGINVKIRYAGVAVPTALEYGAESWSMSVMKKEIFNVMERSCPRSME